jgi:hypothetical protein
MCQNVIHAERSKPITWSREDCCNLWVFWIKNGKTLAWTSLWAYVRLPTRLTRYGWFLIASPSLPTLYPCTPTSQQRSKQRSTLLASSFYMEFQRWSCPIEGHSLFLVSGNNCMLPLELTWSTVQPTTHRRMVKQSEWFRFWKICLEHASHGPSFHIIIAIKRASRWLEEKVILVSDSSVYSVSNFPPHRFVYFNPIQKKP